MRALRGFTQLLQQLDEAIFPSSLYCLCCGAMIDESRSYSLCDDCVRKFHWITGATCDACGKALPERDIAGSRDTKNHEDSRDHEDPRGPRLCYDCMVERPLFTRGFSCVTYGLHEREIMMDLKYAGRGYIARKCGDMMFDRIEGEITSGAFSPERSHIDMIVPVPIGSDRGTERGYNQSAIMAAQLARRWRQHVSDAKEAERQDQSIGGIRQDQAAGNVRQEQAAGNVRQDQSIGGIRQDQAALVRSAPVLYEDLLYRRRKTRKLRSLSPAERALELSGAFKVRSRYVERVRSCRESGTQCESNTFERSSKDPETRGARILLVDDIHTTGATANACTKALFDAGASEVFFLSWASGGNRKPAELDEEI